MQFNSLSYFLFLPLVYLLFFLSNDRYRWAVLLCSSLIFYSALGRPYLLLVLLGLILVNYFLGLRLFQEKAESRKSRILAAGVGINVGLLIGMKYLPFLLENLHPILGPALPGMAWPAPPLLVSIGVSFYVFQAISYLNDVYRDIQGPERHLGYFALYMCFFPKLMQGPIERAGHLLEQLRRPYAFDYENIRMGLVRIAWGLFKKLAIADRLAVLVNTVHGNVEAYTGLPLIVATYAYAIQIYTDFSAYTDIALGTAQIFNIRLVENFNKPYFATSVADFWRRWHISLSSWLLDYVFKPLQMRWRNLAMKGTVLALFATVLVSGIWHGAAWNFIIWGLLHGAYIASGEYLEKPVKKIWRKMHLEGTAPLKAWRILLTFNLVSFAWIFFRARSFSDAQWVLRHLFVDLRHQLAGFSNIYLALGNIGISKEDFGLSLILVGALFVIELFEPPHVYLMRKPAWVRWTGYYALVLSIWLLGMFGVESFVYLQF